MDSRRDAVRAQLNHTISMLEEELDRNLNLLGAAGMRATPKPVGVKVHFAPSRESSPAGNVEHTRGTHEAYQTPPSVVHSSRRPTEDEHAGSVHHGDFSLHSNLPRSSSSKPISLPDTYDGKTPLEDWLTNLELCSQINGWSKEQKTRFLAVRLRGSALQVYTDLSDKKKNDFSELVNALKERFSPKGQVELHRAQLRARSRKRGESLPELASEIRRLVVKAYPNVSSEVREEIGRDQFIESLDLPEVRMQVRRAKPKSLGEALSLALEEEAFLHLECNKELPKKLVASATQQTDSGLERKVHQLEQSVAELKSLISSNSRQSRWSKGPLVCWKCQQPGHRRSECPELAAERVSSVKSTAVDQGQSQVQENSSGLSRGPLLSQN